MAKLLGIAGLTAGREYELGELSVLGRSPNAHIRLPDLAVSRQHAKITRQGNTFTIEDLESVSGTAVNDQYVQSSVLGPGDEIGIGSFRFRFVDGAVDKVSTADFEVTLDQSQTRVVSVDAARFTRVEPVPREAPVSQVARLSRRLNATLMVGQAASRSQDANELLDQVMEHCLQLFPGADRALVAVPDRERQSLTVLAIAQRRDLEQAQFALSRGVVSDVLYQGRSVIADAGAGLEGDHGAVMVAPLICHGQMLGLTYVDQLSGDARPFGEEDLEVLTGMAAHVALALHAAQLRDEVMRQSRTEQELAAAHEVQKRFLPRGVPHMPGFSFVTHYGPCRDVGGDLYDFIPLDGASLGVVIGDVSGKGFAAAIVMAWVASQLRVAALQERDPAAVLMRVNAGLMEAHQDELFVTLVYGVLNRSSMTFRFCNAGHVPPLVRRASGAVEVLDQGAGLPVGVVTEVGYEERRVALDRGDQLLLVTDGVTEAMDAERQMFGIPGLVDAVARSGGVATGLISHVLGAVRAFVGHERQYDDITIVTAAAVAEDMTTTVPPGGLAGRGGFSPRR